MYTAREDRRSGDDRRAAPRGERPYGRRIDCEEDGSARTRTSTPARGGGQRDPEAWASRQRG